MRDLIRLRGVVRQIVTRARQHLQGFLLRHSRKHGRGTAWRMAYRRWLSTLAFEHPAQQVAFQDYVDAVMDAERRLERVEEQISGLLPEWNLRPVVDALQAGFAIFIERAERNAEAVKMGKPKSAIGSGATEEEPSSDQPFGIYLAAEG